MEEEKYILFELLKTGYETEIVEFKEAKNNLILINSVNTFRLLATKLTYIIKKMRGLFLVSEITINLL